MLGPLFAVFAEKVGGDILDISWAWATYLIVNGILIFFFGKISDEKIKKEKLLVAGYFLNALLTFGYIFVSTKLHLFLIQAGLGVAAAMATPTWDAVYSKIEDKKIAGLEWGLADGLANFLSGVAILIGGMIVAYSNSFSSLFFVMGCVQLVGAFTVYRILKFKK